jgi:hypothetical protein
MRDLMQDLNAEVASQRKGAAEEGGACCCGQGAAAQPEDGGKENTDTKRGLRGRLALLAAGLVLWWIVYANLERAAFWVTETVLGLSTATHLGEAVRFSFMIRPRFSSCWRSSSTPWALRVHSLRPRPPAAP